MRKALALLLLLSCGCVTVDVGRVEGQQPWSSVAKRNYEIVAHGLSGEACQYSLLGIPMSREHPSAAYRAIYTAADKLVDKQDYALINVLRDTRLSWWVVVWQTCSVVVADVAVLKEPVPDALQITTATAPGSPRID